MQPKPNAQNQQSPPAARRCVTLFTFSRDPGGHHLRHIWSVHFWGVVRSIRELAAPLPAVTADCLARPEAHTWSAGDRGRDGAGFDRSAAAAVPSARGAGGGALDITCR